LRPVSRVPSSPPSKRGARHKLRMEALKLMTDLFVSVGSRLRVQFWGLARKRGCQPQPAGGARNFIQPHLAFPTGASERRVPQAGSQRRGERRGCHTGAELPLLLSTWTVVAGHPEGVAVAGFSGTVSSGGSPEDVQGGSAADGLSFSRNQLVGCEPHVTPTRVWGGVNTCLRPEDVATG
jgi:hypothetical protein